MSVDVSLGARRYRDAIKALKSLVGAGYQARLAGGSVRDRLLGFEPKDFDVATSAKPTEVIRHFEAVGSRTVPTGIDHGTVTLVMPSGPVEITTLRTDVKTDGRHAEVAFGTNFEEDAARRDFTVNAMFEDENGVIYDYHGGQADLAAKTLRFVGDPVARIREDYLRILRFFRFWSQLSFMPAPGTLDAVRSENTGLSRISQERITSELLRLFAGDGAASAARGLRETGVWPLVLPEAAAAPASGPWPASGFWQAFSAAAGPVRGMVAIAACIVAAGPFDDNAWAAVGPRLKLSIAETRTLAFIPALLRRLAAPRADIADALDLIDAMEQQGGADALTRVFRPLVRAANIAGRVDERVARSIDELTRAEEKFGARRRAKLPLDGNEVMATLRLNPGPELGLAMEKLKRGFRNGTFQTADEARAWLKT